jgi:hypothetical protein
VNSSYDFLLHVIGDARQLLQTGKRTVLSVEHINAALESRMQEPLYGFSNSPAPRLISAGQSGGLELYWLGDRQIPLANFTRFIAGVYPRTVAIDAEWISVLGKSPMDHEEDEPELDAAFEPDFTLGVAQPEPDSDIAIASSQQVLSYEHQVLYRTIRGKLFGGDSDDLEDILRVLSRESCLQTLLPYFVRLGKLLLRDYPRSFRELYVSIAIVRALFANQSLRFLDIYLQDFISICLTLLLSPSVLPRNLFELLLLQEHASELLQRLCDRAFARPYPSLQPTLTSQLMSIFIETNRNLVEKLGSLIGLAHLGLETVSRYVLPILKGLLRDLDSPISDLDLDRQQLRSLMYRQAVATGGRALHADTYKMAAVGFLPLTSYSAATYIDLADAFGADMVPYIMDESSMLYL